MRPSQIFSQQRCLVREAASRHHLVNPRFFGSVLERTDQEGSDLDLLVDAPPGTTMFDLGALQAELETLLGIRVDVLTPADLPNKFRAQVLAAAQPV